MVEYVYNFSEGVVTIITIKRFIVGHKNSDGTYLVPGADSAGGVSFEVCFINDSDSEIKYITFHVVPYNAVNDSVGSQYDHQNDVGYRGTGPLGRGKQGSFFFENCWYNSTIKYAKIVDVDIIYMDESTEHIAGDQLNINDSSAQGANGCYVATCVYGSYNCPQVWTLRRYRDQKLASTWYGRVFIHTYYATAPTAVKLFGKTKWFNTMFRWRLDKMVDKLKKEGFEGTPYDDMEW